MKTLRHWMLVLVALLLIAPALRAEEQAGFEPYEAWYVLKLGGQRAGHMHSSIAQEGEHIVNQTTMVVAIKRGDSELRIEQASRFVETTDHKPIRAESRMKLAVMATQQSIDFNEDAWVITTQNAGQQTVTQVAPVEADWLTPGGLMVALTRAIAAGEDDITATTIDPASGIAPVTIEMKREETRDIEVFGRVIPATRWTTTMSNAPGIVIEQWADETGQPVRQTIPLLPGMEIEMLLADRALALAEFDAPEMLAASFITPDKPIDNPRKLKRAVFDLVAKDMKKNLGETVPSAGYQTTQWIDDSTLRVTIDLDTPTVPKQFVIDDAYMASSSMLNYQDKAVAKLIESTHVVAAIESANRKPSPAPVAKEKLRAAKTLRDFVRDHIETKDLSVGFASASETARTETGDCTEHACLLAAMLRGSGIHSRTVTGLVYADQFAGHEGIFGFHMWTQAWLTDENGQQRWVDLDAALPGDVDGFDATHIALSTSAMADGESFNDMVTLMPLMQGMAIKVIETQWAE